MIDFTSKFKQIVTFWERGDPDGYGDYSYADPVQLKGRWEDSVKIIDTAFQREVVSTSQVFLGEALTPDGYLYLGDTVETTPKTLQGARPILKVVRVPSLNGLQILWIAYL